MRVFAAFISSIVSARFAIHGGAHAGFAGRFVVRDRHRGANKAATS